MWFCPASISFRTILHEKFRWCPPSGIFKAWPMSHSKTCTQELENLRSLKKYSILTQIRVYKEIWSGLFLAGDQKIPFKTVYATEWNCYLVLSPTPCFYLFLGLISITVGLSPCDVNIVIKSEYL